MDSGPRGKPQALTAEAGIVALVHKTCLIGEAFRVEACAGLGHYPHWDAVWIVLKERLTELAEYSATLPLLVSKRNSSL